MLLGHMLTAKAQISLIRTIVHSQNLWIQQNASPDRKCQDRSACLCRLVQTFAVRIWHNGNFLKVITNYDVGAHLRQSDSDNKQNNNGLVQNT